MNNIKITSNYDKSYDKFEDMKLSPEILKGIFAYGWEKPSKIQEIGIMPVIDGRNCIIQAQSGTGKTGTFSISCLNAIDPSIISCQIIIISPTREIAEQTLNVISKLGTYTKYNIYGVIGGKKLETYSINNAQIIVGTPGRIFDQIKRNNINMTTLKLFVIDEADIMFQKGFKEQITSIIEYSQDGCQIALYSATLPMDILEMITKFIKNPVQILVKKEQLTLEGIKQWYVGLTSEEDKYETLKDLYGMIGVGQSIIYCSYKRKVEWLKDNLTDEKYPVVCIHGEMSQEIRDNVMSDFRAGNSRILITTDLLARGIDVHQVSLVINYDLPNDKESYIHRIGRSGRYGRKGYAINFVTTQDSQYIKDIEKFYNTCIEPLPADIKEIMA
tara:strand:+ start:149 stop:1309 length:1161 start_codon:yes stop_codon:yes gene_type:complete